MSAWYSSFFLEQGDAMARGLVRHAWQLWEALLQCPEHWHFSTWLQEFLERSSRQATGLSLHRVANDTWESL